MNNKAMKLLIFGKTGSGISSTANTILGENIFEVKAGMVSTRVPFHSQKTSRQGQRIEVFSVSGTFPVKNTEKGHTFEFEKEGMKEIVIEDLTAILLIISASDRFTDDDCEVYETMKERIGDDVMLKKLIVVFTACSDVDESEIESEFRKILTDANRRYVCIDNTGSAWKKERQVRNLLTVVDRLTNDKAPKRKLSLWQMILLFLRTLICCCHINNIYQSTTDFTGQEEIELQSFNRNQ